MSLPFDVSRLPFDQRNTARETRARYDFQDECVAWHLLSWLLTGEHGYIVVEWCSDYVAVPSNAPPQIVSVKHRESDTREFGKAEVEEFFKPLYSYWDASGRSLGTMLVTNRLASTPTPEGLAHRCGIPNSDATQFHATLRIVEVPQRRDIGVIATDQVRAVLKNNNEPAEHAEACYEALLAAIKQRSVDMPPSAAERADHFKAGVSLPRVADRVLDTEEVLDLLLRVCGRRERTGRLPASPPAIEVSDWVGGRQLDVDAVRYLLYDPIQRGNGYQDARGRRLTPPGADVWIRQADGNTLRTERDLLASLCSTPGLPDIVAYSSAILVLHLPAGRSLADTYGPPDQPAPPVVLESVLRSLATLERPLHALHRRGRAHRDLTPGTVFVANGKAALCHAGLACRTIQPGEGPSDYRAPEQWRPLQTQVGPAADVFQLAAVAYHYITARVPGPAPLAIEILRPGLDPQLAEQIDRALRADPGSRPALAHLCRQLTRAGRMGALR